MKDFNIVNLIDEDGPQMLVPTNITPKVLLNQLADFIYQAQLDKYHDADLSPLHAIFDNGIAAIKELQPAIKQDQEQFSMLINNQARSEYGEKMAQKYNNKLSQINTNTYHNAYMLIQNALNLHHTPFSFSVAHKSWKWREIDQVIGRMREFQKIYQDHADQQIKELLKQKVEHQFAELVVDYWPEFVKTQPKYQTVSLLNVQNVYDLSFDRDDHNNVFVDPYLPDDIFF